MSNGMPSFDFSKADYKDDAELTKAVEEKAKSSSTVFRPGRYEVVIEAAKFLKINPNDSNWGDYEVQYKGANGRQIRDYLRVPYKTQVFGDKKSFGPYNHLKTFCAALGQELQTPTLADQLKKLFSKPEKLVGKSVTVEIGFRKGYIKWTGKAEDGTNRYVLCTRDHSEVRGSDGSALEFSDPKAAELYATDKNIAIDRFPNVLTYAKSAQATTGTTNDPW